MRRPLSSFSAAAASLRSRRRRRRRRAGRRAEPVAARDRRRVRAAAVARRCAAANALRIIGAQDTIARVPVRHRAICWSSTAAPRPACSSVSSSSSAARTGSARATIGDGTRRSHARLDSASSRSTRRRRSRRSSTSATGSRRATTSSRSWRRSCRPDADRDEPSGEPDFTAIGRVLVGQRGSRRPRARRLRADRSRHRAGRRRRARGLAVYRDIRVGRHAAGARRRSAWSRASARRWRSRGSRARATRC